jgi:hypothetical protein
MTKSAKGIKGILMYGMGEKGVMDLPYIRIPADNEDGFEDITLVHNDLDIQILDDDAFIKETADGEKYIDYSDKTLGREDEG